MRSRFVVTLLAAFTAACEPNEAPTDATTLTDTSGMDAAGMDAAHVDAFPLNQETGLEGADAGQLVAGDAFEDDARNMDDGGISLDASWGPCMALGLAGTCMSMSLCVA